MKKMIFAALVAVLFSAGARADGGTTVLAVATGVMFENYRNNIAAWEAFPAKHPDSAPACLKAPSEKVKAENGNYYFDRAPQCGK